MKTTETKGAGEDKVQITNLKSAKNYIDIQSGTIYFLETMLRCKKETIESNQETIAYKNSTIKALQEVIEQLRIGEIHPETYSDMQVKIINQDSTIKKLNINIKLLRKEANKEGEFDLKNINLN